ncbi:molybdopterin-dependent oxidoreductase [Calidifontibacter sp. DB0510]|uniref:Molybdopterin-dependent oxidoreductase n=1 Tax=Metallococcus carri TaxID=1656884 RepID=A0A967AZ37_9MICO|nr:molybdopterin-dependent oxidoreductase [Metallococcus carri]NHN55739.1 molybdopterin-dependent oxidoreductase [Metallococcus carri]NOP38572.1 molybdopterin-dependent oxidoreductase [Calidifontibacter sp. DB2511S]
MTATRWRAIVGGLVTGLVTLGLAELLAGLLTRFGWSSGAGSPVLSVGGAFIDRTPPWLKDFAVSTFGTADKTVLLIGISLVLTVLSAVVGLLAFRRFAAGVTLFVVLVAVAALAIVTRPDSGAFDPVPLLVGAYAGLLTLRAWWHRARGTSEGATGPDRRALLRLGAGGAALGVLGIVAGRVVSGSARAVDAARKAFVVPFVKTPVRIPSGVSVGVPGVTPFLDPWGQFYRIDTALSVPQIDPAQWQLKVTGMVEREITLTWDELLAKPMQQALITLMCVSNEVGGRLNGNAIWTGWPVRELLKEAGVKPGADMVLSRSSDGFTAGTPLEALTDNRNSLLAVAMNSRALPPEHGFPVRLVVPGLYGYVSATKWVVELKVTTFAADQGYWTPRGWSAKGPVKTSSRIDVPADGDTVDAGTVAIAGVAWAQHRGIKAVEVQVDSGPWQPAELGTEATIDAWRQWVVRWKATSGRHTVKVRAIDASGAVQIAQEAPPAPDGSTGYHTISVTVR